MARRFARAGDAELNSTVELTNLVQNAAMAYRFLKPRQQEMAEALDTFRKADAFGCFLDPTAYMRSADSRKVGAAILRLALDFIADFEKEVPAHLREIPE